MGGSLGVGDRAGCKALSTTEEHLLMWAISDFSCGLNSVPSVYPSCCPPPQPPALAVSAALFGNRVFADTVQLNEVTLG